MTALSTDAIDREIDTRTVEVAAMSTTMVELDSHPGLSHVRLYPPTGVTARHWTAVEAAIAQLWEDLGRMTAILDGTRAIRARRSKPSEADRAELTHWLRERPLEVSRERVPLARRSLTGSGEVIEYVGLADTADRMRAAYPAVAEFLDEVDRVNTLVVHGLAAVQDRVAATGAPEPAGVADLLAVAATDPLSLSAGAVETRVRAITVAFERQAAELVELAELRSHWAAAVQKTSGTLDALRASAARAGEVRERARRQVLCGPLPAHPDAEPGLRAELALLTADDPAALRALQRRIDEAQRVLDEDERLAQGLLDRRAELAGRLEVYQTKAARLGLGEDRDLLASGRIAAGLLSRRPCDLREVTRAVSAFQQILAQKREAAR
ncbi:uncharacterized protein RMCC_3015 [Mycolicibacterium canariasense]|uniref:Uncharacterized protein n=1 Tax=Mycolicibacterium canariasense TaxID=228230 RepID=A0A117IAA1_MYCCR|nr:hypothetical protein [Mycolicibacterium canariasense]MCV7207885.1 hypothetical protein [Mycolicibacterium canariasense]ORV04928.1 hypothetical protein AWB94_21605 [Mycolicibacterium canariasense]GAS96049.1 uncharacterized protein RMCC_3015 [Mycolicibacterium canariasense]